MRSWLAAAIVSFAPLTGLASPAQAAATFTNPLDLHGPDPWLQYYDGSYYLAATTWNNSVTMRKSATLGGLASAPDRVVFTLTRPNGAGTMWAPELHLLDGPDGKLDVQSAKTRMGAFHLNAGIGAADLSPTVGDESRPAACRNSAPGLPDAAYSRR